MQSDQTHKLRKLREHGVAVILAIVLIPASGLAFPAPMAEKEQLPMVKSQLFGAKLGPVFQCVKLTKLARKLPGSAQGAGVLKAIPQKLSMESGYQHVGEGFGTFLYELHSALTNRDYPRLASFMHPRLKANAAMMAKAIGALDIGTKSTVSFHRIWAIYSYDNSSTDIPCPAEDITLSGHYGHQLQFFIWMSLAGDKEIGRVLVSVVPVDGHLYLGVLRSQMWTHSAKNPTQWIQMADAELQKNQPISAYVKYNLAHKLMNGGSYLKLGLAKKVQSFLTTRMSEASFLAEVKKLLPPVNSAVIAQVVPILTRGGAGLYFKFAIPEEWSSKAINQHCAAALTTLGQYDWMKNLTGIRCGYYLPTEKDYSKSSYLGTLYLESPKPK